MSGPTEPKVFDECIASQCSGQGEVGNPFASSNRVVVPNANLGTHLYANVNCFGAAFLPNADMASAIRADTQRLSTCTPPTSCSNRRKGRA